MADKTEDIEVLQKIYDVDDRVLDTSKISDYDMLLLVHLVNKIDDIKHAGIFGSSVEGELSDRELTKDSDIDLAVIVSNVKTISDISFKINRRFHKRSESNREIDVTCFNKSISHDSLDVSDKYFRKHSASNMIVIKGDSSSFAT